MSYNCQFIIANELLKLVFMHFFGWVVVVLLSVGSLLGLGLFLDYLGGYCLLDLGWLVECSGVGSKLPLCFLFSSRLAYHWALGGFLGCLSGCCSP